MGTRTRYTCFTYMFYMSKCLYNVECIFYKCGVYLPCCTWMSCTLVQLNSRGTLAMHQLSKLITSTRTVNCKPHVVHHTNKLVTSASSLYRLPLLRSTTVAILLNENSSLQILKALQVNYSVRIHNYDHLYISVTHRKFIQK